MHTKGERCDFIETFLEELASWDLRHHDKASVSVKAFRTQLAICWQQMDSNCGTFLNHP